jgi:hypothetical protein
MRTNKILVCSFFFGFIACVFFSTVQYHKG